MHSNLWATLYLLLVASGLLLLFAAILKLTRRKKSKLFLRIGIGLLIFPLVFLVGHFMTVNNEMKKKAGVYVASYQPSLNHLCVDTKFETLILTLDKNGSFFFGKTPCFTNRIQGQWQWWENMVTTGTSFDHINDTLRLYFPDDNSDSIILTSFKQTYLVFKRVR